MGWGGGACARFCENGIRRYIATRTYIYIYIRIGICRIYRLSILRFQKLGGGGRVCPVYVAPRSQRVPLGSRGVRLDIRV